MVHRKRPSRARRERALEIAMKREKLVLSLRKSRAHAMIRGKSVMGQESMGTNKEGKPERLTEGCRHRGALRAI